MGGGGGAAPSAAALLTAQPPAARRTGAPWTHPLALAAQCSGVVHLGWKFTSKSLGAADSFYALIVDYTEGHEREATTAERLIERLQIGVRAPAWMVWLCRASSPPPPSTCNGVQWAAGDCLGRTHSPPPPAPRGGSHAPKKFTKYRPQNFWALQ